LDIFVAAKRMQKNGTAMPRIQKVRIGVTGSEK
jgi:hypothetical protein